MANLCKYYKQVRQVSYDSGVTWVNLGEVQKGDLYEYNSPSCGGVTEYRWVNVTGAYTCVGTTKYQKTKKQQSTDGGTTWTDVSPAEYGTGEVIEYASTDCGYVPPTPGAGVITYIAQTKLMETTLYEKSTLASIENYIATDSFSGSTGQLTITSHTFENGVGTITFNDRVVVIGVMALSYCEITGIDIPNGVTSIDSYAFAGCTGLTSVNIPSTVTSIGNSAFYGCYSLTSVNIPSSVTSIGMSAFLDCYSLRSIYIPDSVISIDDAAFENCGYLTSATVGSGVTYIGDYAFESCDGLTSITIKATNPPTLGNTRAFDGSSCPIYVPSQSLNAFKSASGWSDYASRIQSIP